MSYAKRHKFTAAEKTFLRRCSDRYNRIERLEAFNKRFNLNLTVGQVDNFCKCNGINSRHTFSREEKEWLVNEWDEFGRVDLITKKFNETFDKKRTYSSINHFYDLNGFKKRVHYTEEQDEWLLENINSMKYTELVEEFNRHFNLHKTYASIHSHCSDIGALQTDKDRILFESRKMRSLTNRPVGHERTLNKGITYIKYRESEFEDSFSGVSRFSQTYMDKRRYMYQMYHPDDVLTYDDSIVQVDGDRNNYGEDNLIKVPKCVSMRFSKMLRKHPNNTKDMNMAWIQIFSIDSELNKEEECQ